LGSSNSLYLKKHLVPFGEFLPLKSYLSWVLKFLHIPWSDFAFGPAKQPDFVVNDIYIAPFLCYEISYQNLVLEYLPKAELLLTITEDSWFGRSIAQAQQLEIARMRSLETGRYQIVCANSGITAIIGPTGKIEAKMPSFKRATLTGEVSAMVGATPFTIGVRSFETRL
jgi:apolipoprotein N-acyltransferase